MKINFILPGIGQSGGIRVALMYANALVDRGHDVLCYYPLTGIYVGWKKILFPKAILRQMRDAYNADSWIDKKFAVKSPMVINNLTVRDADVTIATYWLTAYWVNRLSSTKGRKVYFVQGYEVWGNALNQTLGRRSYTLKMDKVIAVSSNLARRLYEEFGINAEVVCNGISEKELGVPFKKGKIVSIGIPYREGTLKNIRTALEVFKALNSNNGVKWKTFGFNKPNDWLDDIEFLENPSREQLQQFYKTTDIFYVPSLYEGWGLPAVEAMAHGCVVLAHNSGAIAEFGRDQENCIVLQNPKDPAEAEEKISELIVNTEKRKKIGLAAWKTVVEGYTFEAASKKFEEALKG